MAIDNSFRTDETQIKSEPLREYNHLVSVGEIGIYRHKSKREFYVSNVIGKPYYDDYGISLRMFQTDFIMLKYVYMTGKSFIFENYENEILFRELMKIT